MASDRARITAPRFKQCCSDIYKNRKSAIFRGRKARAPRGTVNAANEILPRSWLLKRLQKKGRGGNSRIREIRLNAERAPSASVGFCSLRAL